MPAPPHRPAPASAFSERHGRRIAMTRLAVHRAALTRKEWVLVALGLAAWMAIIAVGVWFVHQMTRSQAACGTSLEARSLKPRSTPTAGPRNSLQQLTGTGKCPR